MFCSTQTHSVASLQTSYVDAMHCIHRLLDCGQQQDILAACLSDCTDEGMRSAALGVLHQSLIQFCGSVGLQGLVTPVTVIICKHVSFRQL